MKRTTLFLAALMAITCGWSQNLSKSEAKSLQAFATQASAKGGDNGSALGFTGGSFANFPGITVSADGHVTEIDWRNKDLAGNLDLSKFPALQKVNVSGNKIVTLTLSANPQLVEVNAGHNRITDVTLTDCPQLQTLRLNRNRQPDGGSRCLERCQPEVSQLHEQSPRESDDSGLPES